MASPTPAVERDAIFEALEEENRILVLNRVRLQIACHELAQANGSGDGVRRKIRAMLARLVETKHGSR